VELRYTARMQKELKEWVYHPASLTKRLNEYTHHQIDFVLNKQYWIDTSTWCREISWEYGDKIWVLAKTFIPKVTLGEFSDTLLKEPTRPVGEILFSDEPWIRGPIQVREIDAHDDYYSWAKNYVSELPETLALRQSNFTISKKTLTVVEVFMPDFLKIGGDA